MGLLDLLRKDDEPKTENVVNVLYFNTNSTFIDKELPVKDDGTVTYGNKMWVVSKYQPYLCVNDSIFSRKKVKPYYILSSESAFPLSLEIDKKEPKNEKDNPLVLNELVKYKALKQMMDFKITKEGQSGEGSKLVKFILIGALLVGAYFVIRYVWLGAGQ